MPAAVREAVRHAASRVPVAIVSGAYRREIEPVVARAGLADVVQRDRRRGRRDARQARPGGIPAGARARSATTSRPADVVAFEDTEAGVASARAAGLRCLAVRGTLADERLAAADGIVDAIDVELVRSLVG